MGESVSVVYVVLSHRLPDQVRRLVEAILRSSRSARVVVWHDARNADPPALCDPRVEVVSHRHPADWGSWEIVQTTMAAFQQVQVSHDPDLVVLVSGQDYPARPLEPWERETVRAGGWAGTSWPLRYSPRWGKPYGRGNDEWTRYAYAWYRVPRGAALRDSTSPLADALRWVLGRVGHYLEPIVCVRVVSRGRGYVVGLRRFGKGSLVTFHRGSQWVALNRDALNHVVSSYTRDRTLRRIFTRSVIPDESYLQTVLSTYSPPTGGPVTYVEWVVELDAPRTLTQDDLPTILSSGSPFCRKVEPGTSDELMDLLDARSRRVG